MALPEATTNAPAPAPTTPASAARKSHSRQHRMPARRTKRCLWLTPSNRDGNHNQPGRRNSRHCSVAASNGTNGLRLNFRNAPLDRVLKLHERGRRLYYCVQTKAARGPWMSGAIHRDQDEAVNLLNQAPEEERLRRIRNEENTHQSFPG